MNEAIKLLSARQLEECAVALLRPHERNPRKHSAKQLKQIEAGIRKFGFLNPVLIDERQRVRLRSNEPDSYALADRLHVTVVNTGATA